MKWLLALVVIVPAALGLGSAMLRRDVVSDATGETAGEVSVGPAASSQTLEPAQELRRLEKRRFPERAVATKDGNSRLETRRLRDGSLRVLVEDIAIAETGPFFWSDIRDGKLSIGHPSHCGTVSSHTAIVDRFERVLTPDEETGIDRIELLGKLTLEKR